MQSLVVCHFSRFFYVMAAFNEYLLLTKVFLQHRKLCIFHTFSETNLAMPCHPNMSTKKPGTLHHGQDPNPPVLSTVARGSGTTCGAPRRRRLSWPSPRRRTELRCTSFCCAANSSWENSKRCGCHGRGHLVGVAPGFTVVVKVWEVRTWMLNGW